MSSIERYGESGWYLVLLPGVLAAGLLALIGWGIRAAMRLPQRFRRNRVV